MANSKSLSKEEVGKLFYRLCLAISKTKNEKEAADFLRDLLSYPEAEMIAKRLKIAEMLLEGNNYEDIRSELRVGNGTVARVKEWLDISGGGYRKVIEKIKGKKVSDRSESPIIDVGTIRKKYPMYYWPEIVLEDIIKNSNQKQKRKIKAVIDSMEKMKRKTPLYRKLKKLL